MDQGDAGSRATGLPRFSRLPKITARASHDNLRLAHSSQAQDPVKSSHLPQPTRQTSSRIVPPAPLGENLNRSIRDKYGWSSLQPQSRNRSPVRDALQVVQSTLHTTPPSATQAAPVFDHGDENPIEVQKTVTLDVDPATRQTEKRKPRPSLSERTIETLSRVPPSPSPTRRRSSMATHDGLMGPPGRPVSSMRISRPTTPGLARSPSPTKQPFRPPGRASPTKVPPVPAVPSPGSLYTPPRAFVKGGTSRFGRSVQPSSRSISGHTTVQVKPAEGPKTSTYASKTMRIKSSGLSGSTSGGTADGKVALDSIFKDPRASQPQSQDHGGSIGLLRPRSSNDSTAAPLIPPRTKSSTRLRHGVKAAASNSELEAAPATPSRSSAALRETIAKAKAARRAANSAIKDTDSDVTPALQMSMHSEPYPTPAIDGSNRGLLKKRLEGAVASGNLNLAAMGFEQIPSEVLKMYDTTTSISWAEMVDLTKFNMADNKIAEVTADVFPDWSAEEMYDDDEKTNQFAGLETLDLHHNLLHTMPIGLRRMERLTTLNLSGNRLSNQVLTVIWQIPNLQSLNLARNQLTGAINISTMITAQLRSLDLHHNELTEIQLTAGQVSTLQKLDVSSNQLCSFPWAELAGCELFELNVASNRLIGLVFEGVTHGYSTLARLDFSHNSFDGFADGASSLTGLQSVTGQNNSIQELPNMDKWQDLTTLQLSENKLTVLHASLYSLPKLKNLDLSQNNIRSIDSQVGAMESLTSVALAGNPLRERKYLTMSTDDLKQDLQRRLGEGKASLYTPIGKADPHDGGYDYKVLNGVLDLSSSNLSSIDVKRINFRNDSQPVHTLRLTNNDFTTFPTELLSHSSIKASLRSLDLSHNPHLDPIEYLTSAIDLPSLQSLYLVSTGLTSLDALMQKLVAPELNELNISCHRLTGGIPAIRRSFPECTTLLACDNWFSSVDVEHVAGLEVLDIRNNQIERLPPGIGLLGNHSGKREAGRLRVFESSGNIFRVPRLGVVEKGTEAVLKDLRRMVPEKEVPDTWRGEI